MGGNDRAVPLVKCLEASLHARIERGWRPANAKGAFRSDDTEASSTRLGALVDPTDALWPDSVR